MIKRLIFPFASLSPFARAGVGLLFALFTLFPETVSAQEWPVVKQEAKPGTRWWWLGSAVDSVNLTYNLETYAKAGIGAVEITPIYGVQGNEKNDIDFLSPRWMRMLGHVEAEGNRLGIEIDMNTGTGWPFGGPEVSVDEAATRVYFTSWHAGEVQPELSEKEKKNFPKLQKIYAYLNLNEILEVEEQAKEIKKESKRKEFLDNYRFDTLFVAYYIAKTRQQVKRAAPGGEGYVLDHFNPTAVQNYFKRFDKAFAASGVPYPHTFFNDSYEVYEADWTPAMLEEFKARRGYALEEFFPVFMDASYNDSKYFSINQRTYPQSKAVRFRTHEDVIADYRMTLHDLLMKMFTNPWVKWAHKHEAKVRNQAHGSPANLLDIYAAVDIPEIESFGLSDFGIVGLRSDTLTRKNDSDLSMLKYPASAAHFYGKEFVSAETFTWLTEHFRTSLSQCKPDFDLMMVAGVNHCYFHGTTYSPKDAPWPGYLFYASMEMSPINTIWEDAPAFFEYMTRVQSWMQYGQPDNDLLVYLPFNDIIQEYPGRLLQFDIHSMAKKAPRFIHAVNTIYNAGYDMDYCSDRMILDITGVDNNGYIIAPSGVRYKALILPEVKMLPDNVKARLEKWKVFGATIISVDSPDEYVSALKQFPKIVPEDMTALHGLKFIRRHNVSGYHYFITSLQNKGVDGWVALATEAHRAYLFNPLTGGIQETPVRKQNGRSEVYLRLASGESCILQTIVADRQITEFQGQHLISNSKPKAQITRLSPTPRRLMTPIDLTGNSWTLTPRNFETWGSLKSQTIRGLKPWTALGKTWETGKGTVRYKTTANVPAGAISGSSDVILDLGDVRESAHVYINGRDVGVVFCAPFQLSVGKYLRAGSNTIEIDVTGLAANYVAEMDRQGIVWRIFKNANIANLKGGAVSYYGNWDIMPGGLNSTVKLVPVK